MAGRATRTGVETEVGYELAPPPAAAMVEALRGVGYSLPAAIADLIDNSIAAGAGTVWLRFWWAGRNSYISVLDDGSGMDDSELSLAMRPGCRNPLECRSPTDLGRFGLGLKTASFSQCRRLTVASRRSGMEKAVRRWDLDHVASTNDWQLLREPAKGSAEALLALDRVSQGTLVLWEVLDRVVGDCEASDRRSHDAFLEQVERVENHVSMVFHRFLEGRFPALRLFVNGDSARSRIRPWDPFCLQLAATERTPVERLLAASGPVEVQGFVLPHKDRLTEAEYTEGGGPEGWTAQQGFHVYRNLRMLVAGDWLGLGRPRPWTKEESYRLARLRLDIGNSADLEWEIDIKKSRAKPPQSLRSRLTDLADQVRAKARRVYAHRGTYGHQPAVPNLTRAWVSSDRGDSVSYRIDRNHPAVSRVLRDVPPNFAQSVEAMLRVIEETVPVQRIWLESVEKGGLASGGFSHSDENEVVAIATSLYRHLVESVGMGPQQAKEHLLKTEPFQNYSEMIATLDQEPAPDRGPHEK